jgi:hypothetical protein
VDLIELHKGDDNAIVEAGSEAEQVMRDLGFEDKAPAKKADKAPAAKK